MKKTIIYRAVIAALAASAAGGAAASGFQLLEQNGSGLGNAYAGSAANAENASTIFYNPAGMTQLKGSQVSTGLAYVSATYKFNNNASNSGAFTGTGDGVDGGTPGSIPNFYVSQQFAEKWFGGVGVGAPFGLKTHYSTPWAGAAQSTLFNIKTVNVNPSVAYKATDKLSFGFGLDYEQLEAQYQRQASTLTVFSLSSDSVALQAQGHAWGWNTGVLYQASDAMKLGFAYRSRMNFHLVGDLQASGPSAALLASNTGAASTDLTLPDTFTFSVTQTLSDKWEMLGDISRTRWSSVQDVDIKLNSSNTTVQTLAAHFRDTWRVALGSNYTINSAWKLKTGIGYDQGVAKGADYRLVSLPDNDRLWLSLGAQWTATPAFKIDAGVSYLKVRNAAIYNDQTSANRGLVDGVYHGKIWVLGTQLSYAF